MAAHTDQQKPNYVLMRPLSVEFEFSNSGTPEGFSQAISKVIGDIFEYGDFKYLCCMIVIESSGQQKVNFSRISALTEKIDGKFEELCSTLSCAFSVPYKIKSDAFHPFYIFGFDETVRFSDDIPDVGKSAELQNLRLVKWETCVDILKGNPSASMHLASVVSARSSAQAVINAVKLFEAAFNMPHNKLKNRLHRFIETGQLNIPKNLIDQWIQVRHALSHADRKKPYFELDAFRFRRDITYVAYDVALNKSEWGGESYKRQQRCNFSAHHSETGSVLQPGSFVGVQLRLFDYFGRYEAIGGDFKEGAPLINFRAFLEKVESDFGKKVVVIKSARDLYDRLNFIAMLDEGDAYYAKHHGGSE